MLVPTADSILHQVHELRDHQELTDHSMLLAMPWQGLLAHEISIEGSKLLCWRQCRLKLEPALVLAAEGVYCCNICTLIVAVAQGERKHFRCLLLLFFNVHSGVTAVSPGTAQVEHHGPLSQKARNTCAMRCR